MNDFKISNEFQIEVTSHNFTLQEWVESVAQKDTKNLKKGDDSSHWVDRGHYSTLQGSLRGFVNKFADKAGDYESLLVKFKELEDLFTSLGKKWNKN